MKTDKLAQVAEALRRRKTARFPAVTVEGQMPKRVAVDVPPEFQAQEAELKKVQNLGQPEAEQPRPGSVPAQVSQAMLGAAPVAAKPLPQVDDEADIEAAREADRESRFAAGMELAGRQLVGGITRTPVPQGLGANPSEVPLAMARAKSKREQAAEALMRQRQGRLDAENADERKLTHTERAAAALRAEQQRAAADEESRRRFELEMAQRQKSSEATLALANANLGIRGAGERRDAEKFEADKAEKAKGKPLTDSTITDLADTDTALRSLGDLGEQFVALGQEGMAAKVSGKISGALGLTSTDAGKYLSAAKLSMQGVGKIMEGGKLAAGDETKYMGMLPVPGDSFESAARKIKAAQAYLRGLRDDRVKALKAAGRDVPAFGGEETKTVGGKKYKKVPGGWDPVP